MKVVNHMCVKNSIPSKFTAGINKIDNKLCWMTFSVVK